jgi:hypothetical protein
MAEFLNWIILIVGLCNDAPISTTIAISYSFGIEEIPEQIEWKTFGRLVTTPLTISVVSLLAVPL